MHPIKQAMGPIRIRVVCGMNKENSSSNVTPTHEDESIDYALDGCSLTHFEYDENGNTGLVKAAKSLYQKIIILSNTLLEVIQLNLNLLLLLFQIYFSFV